MCRLSARRRGGHGEERVPIELSWRTLGRCWSRTHMYALLISKDKNTVATPKDLSSDFSDVLKQWMRLHITLHKKSRDGDTGLRPRVLHIPGWWLDCVLGASQGRHYLHSVGCGIGAARDGTGVGATRRIRGSAEERAKPTARRTNACH